MTKVNPNTKGLLTTIAKENLKDLPKGRVYILTKHPVYSKEYESGRCGTLINNIKSLEKAISSYPEKWLFITFDVSKQHLQILKERYNTQHTIFILTK
jgi:hypothetical protein